MFKNTIDLMLSESHKIVSRVDQTQSSEHVRRYNMPTIVIVGEEFHTRDIVL